VTTTDTPPTTDRRKPRPCPPILVRPAQAAKLLGIGRATLDRLDARGLTPAARKLGAAKLYDRRELIAWSAAGCPDRRTWTATWSAILAAGRSARK
jgi:predicted DNA-binding transcriptional regulator AlpA